MRTVQEILVRDRNFLSTIVSYITIFLIFININVIHSSLMGIAVSSAFFLINAAFLGNAFFENEDPLPRFLLGALLLAVFLGSISLVVMMVHNLDAVSSTTVLFIVATLSSIINKIAKYTISIEFGVDRSHA